MHTDLRRNAHGLKYAYTLSSLYRMRNFSFLKRSVQQQTIKGGYTKENTWKQTNASGNNRGKRYWGQLTPGFLENFISIYNISLTVMDDFPSLKTGCTLELTVVLSGLDWSLYLGKWIHMCFCQLSNVIKIKLPAEICFSHTIRITNKFVIQILKC